MSNQPWSPYVGSSSLILAIILLIVTGVLLYFATRLQHPIAVKRPGVFLSVALVVSWVVCVIAVLVASYIYIVAEYRQVGHITEPKDYIFPVTATSAVVAFIVIAYLARHSGFWVAVGSAIVGTIAAPMIFELPFDLIIIGRISPPPPGTLLLLIFFTPFILVQLLSFVMLTFSPVMKLSRYTLFLLAGMFVIFAVWALFGFANPATPLPIALNGVSKVLAFAAAVSLFLPVGEKSASSTRQVVLAGQEIGQ
jgi:hypothetical protein